MVRNISGHVRGAFLSAAVFALSGCGGGGGGGGTAGSPGSPPTAAPTPTPVPTAPPPAVSSSSGTVSSSGPTTVFLPPVAGGVSGSLLLTAASTTATIALTLSATPPAGAPALQSDHRVVRAIGAPATGLAYLTAQSSADVSFNSTFGANISVPGTVSGAEYLVMFDPANPNAGWHVVSGPGTAAAGIARGLASINLSFTKGATYDFALISTGATLTLPLPSPTPSAPPSPTPTPAPTPTPTPTPAPTETPTPTPTPTPGPVVVSIPSLQFLGVGSAYAKTIVVTQANYNGQFALGGASCNSITTTDVTTSLQNFTITPLAVGTCAYTLTGGGGAQTTLPVTVTTVTLVGQ
jgi:hypothetical protein